MIFGQNGQGFLMIVSNLHLYKPFLPNAHNAHAHFMIFVLEMGKWGCPPQKNVSYSLIFFEYSEIL